MFFVGASGQLLTFLLTVCLPMVLLLSGPQKIQISENSSYLQISLDTESEFQVNDNVFLADADFVSKSRTQLLKLVDSPPAKFKNKNSELDEIIWILNSSGNKAPPCLL